MKKKKKRASFWFGLVWFGVLWSGLASQRRRPRGLLDELEIFFKKKTASHWIEAHAQAELNREREGERKRHDKNGAAP